MANTNIQNKSRVDVIKTNCWLCAGETNHRVLFTKTEKGEGEKFISDFHVVQCQGCDGVSFLLVEKQITKSKKGISTVHYNYPEELYNGDEYDFLFYEDISELPKRIASLYEEVEEAFKAGSPILSWLGHRTLVEATCIDQKISGANLQKKIRGLHEKGLISAAELPILDKLRVIGNVSAHEIKIIPMEKLKYALDIINHVLKSIYVLPKLNKRLFQIFRKIETGECMRKTKLTRHKLN